MKKHISLFTVVMFVLSLGFFSSAVYAAEPTIYFDSIPENGLVDVNVLSDFNISVSGAEAKSVELFLDGTSLGTKTSEPFSFEVPSDVMGTHTALAKVKIGSDNYIEDQKDFTVFEYSDGIIGSTDYSFLTPADVNVAKNLTIRASGSEKEWNFNRLISAGVTDPKWFQIGTEEDGYSKPGNGKCLRIVPSNDINSSPQDRIYTRLRVANDGASSYVRFETDFFMTSYLDTEPLRFNFGVEGTNGGTKFVVIATASSEGITINGNTYGLSKDEWHHIALEYDHATCEVSAWVDDIQIVDKETIASATILPSINWFKIAPGRPGGEYRIDNTMVYRIIRSPYCEGVLDGTDIIPNAVYTNPSVQLKFNRGIKLLDDAAITLENELGDVALSSVSYDTNNATITLTPENGLEASNSYSLVLPAGTNFESTNEISKSLRVKFKTSAAPLDVISGKIRTAGAKVFFETELSNTAGDSKTLTAYISVYKNGVFQKLIKADNVILATGDKLKVTTPDFVPEQGSELKAFVTDNEGKPISNKIYTFNID